MNNVFSNSGFIIKEDRSKKYYDKYDEEFEKKYNFQNINQTASKYEAWGFPIQPNMGLTQAQIQKNTYMAYNQFSRRAQTWNTLPKFNRYANPYTWYDPYSSDPNVTIGKENLIKSGLPDKNYYDYFPSDQVYTYNHPC